LYQIRKSSLSHITLSALNPNQQKAVTTTEGPVLVLAGPGSGKTRVLTFRIAHLIENLHVSPFRIMATTFTNKAANEMRERVDYMIGHAVQGVRLGTFHSLCAQILRLEAEWLPHHDRNFTIYDSSEQREVVKDILERMHIDKKNHPPYEILGKISKAKNELIPPESFQADGYHAELVERVYHQYTKALRVSNAMDFDDLLMETVRLFEENPRVLEKYQDRLDYLMVDEFQDTNTAQYRLVSLLAGKRHNVFVVGDPDQSIYAFRGADYRNVRRFMEEFSEHTLITLDENYRSHQFILDGAMAVIRRNPDHIRRDLFSKRKTGSLIEIRECESDFQEADFIAGKIRELIRREGYRPRDVAVMYRTNAQSRLLEQGCRREDLPYQIVGGLRFFDRKEIKDVMAYLHVVDNPNDIQRFLRIINVPPRGIGDKSQTALKEWVTERGDGLWQTLRDIQQGYFGPLPSRAGSALAGLAALLQGWIEVVNRIPVLELLDRILGDTDYEMHLALQAKTEEEAQARKENLNEFRRDLMENADLNLREYLERTALMADVDTMKSDQDAVTLMTLHAAKGLEFPVVFIAGVEDGWLPHAFSKDTPENIAEERRLMYVGITRAKDRLYLSYAETRRDYGGIDYRRPSPFLADLPPEILLENRRHPIRTTVLRSPSPFDKLDWGTQPKATAQPRKAKFRSGDMVYHPKYGVGVVMDSQVLDMEVVEVQFENAGIKKIDGSYLVKK
jgi:DNA helicase-2/ATP-dependent DNA helicase PcrA